MLILGVLAAFLGLGVIISIMVWFHTKRKEAREQEAYEIRFEKFCKMMRDTDLKLELGE